MGNIPRIAPALMPTFANWQPNWEAAGIPTFPVGGDRKVPAVKGYMGLNLRDSRALVPRFGESEMFGFPCGRRSGITVLDVDTTDERILADALTRHGLTPTVVRTASGKFHAYYRHSGEGRHIKPWEGLPIDVLGGGYVVAPPSLAGGGSYRFIAGGLDDIAALPVMAVVPTTLGSGTCDYRRGASSTTIDSGTRNNQLFRRALRHARSCDTLDALVDCVETDNANYCDQPLPAEEVLSIAKSAWRYQQEGRNFSGTAGITTFTNAEMDALVREPDALALLGALRRQHRPGTEFVLANGMAGSLGWTLRRFRRARDVLSGGGFVLCLDAGGRGGPHSPPIYRLARSQLL